MTNDPLRKTKIMTLVTSLGPFTVYKACAWSQNNTGNQKKLGNHQKINHFWLKMTKSTPNTKNNDISDQPRPICCLQSMEPTTPGTTKKREPSKK